MKSMMHNARISTLSKHEDLHKRVAKQPNLASFAGCSCSFLIGQEEIISVGMKICLSFFMDSLAADI